METPITKCNPSTNPSLHKSNESMTDTPKSVPPTASKQETETTEQKVDADETWKVQRDHHKQLADKAFRCGGFQTAIGEYTKAIEFDPELVTLYSNRAAAYLKNSEISKALKDARKCVELDPAFVKGHSRLAAALHSLKRYEQALDAYETVLKLDETNEVAKKGKEACKASLEALRQYEQDEIVRKNEAKRKEEEEEQKRGKEEECAGKEEEDDDLDDFFADVEEVTKKKKEEVEERLTPKATNVIKHDKKVLGTSQSQMDRLLQNNHEWRNLNPFYVLQLPIEATNDDISRRYKALSLLLHPDKNGGSEQAQQAFDEVKKAKTILDDDNRAKHTRMLVEEGRKQADRIFKTDQSCPLEELQEKEVMKIFAHVEQQRRLVEKRERQWEQRERKQEDEVLEKEKQERRFDKNWRKEERVDKRVGNWRDFANKKRKT